MFKNLSGKLMFILAVLVVFLYGIFGIPHGGFKQSITNRIHLGLDLKGGTHLVLSVHVAEAIGSATDRDVARIEAAFASGGITGPTIGKLDVAHPETIMVSGVAAGKMSQARSLLQGSDYSIYGLTSQADGFKLTMTQAAISDLETRTLDTSIETIRERIDKLGVSEPVIQKYGLGGERNPGRAAGRRRSRRGSRRLSSRRRSWRFTRYLADHMRTTMQGCRRNGGVIPPDSMLLHGTGIGWVLRTRFTC